MKFILSILFLGLGFQCIAQDMSRGWYGRLAVSYSKGSNKSLYQFDPLGELSNQSYYSTPSLGESILYNGGIGKMFHPNFGFEANLSYLKGFEIDFYGYEFNGYNISAKTKNTQLIFLPTTVFRMDLSKKFHPYIKVGLMIPLLNTSRFYYQVVSKNSSDYANYDYKITNQLNLGINGCVGISYSITPKLEIFFEAEEDNIRSFHRFAELENTTISGNPMLSSTMQSKYTFEKSIKTSNTDASSVLDFPISFNREAYNLGLKFNF